MTQLAALMDLNKSAQPFRYVGGTHPPTNAVSSFEYRNLEAFHGQDIGTS